MVHAMKKPKTRAQLVKDAAVAHTDLNVFAAVQIMLESSLQSASCESEAATIIALAKSAQQTCLRRYDAAMAAVEKAR